ncbi:helix-turn-helix domain-containing protein [Paenibacillus sp. HGF5]|uniref:helix-turn-helix domain-containing protein n=1 Tax=Paenibacillus sp. HGF5 TaxID=908341 RepID=UPI0002071DF9|nr:helix-turn-helix domain-containing protein [Paenibacillus sp. HGF5]EGG38159.1 transcriptional regulator, AraC family [Paenibacillus sp. HGF5]
MTIHNLKSFIVSTFTFRVNWNHFKSKLLLRYVLSYILIFLIPLTGVTMFVYDSAVSGLRTEIEQSNINQLNQVKMTIDSRIAELRELSGRIAYDRRLTPYMVRDDYYRVEAIQALANYKANSSIIEDIFLYYHNDPIIYSYRGLTNVNVAFDSFYRYENWSLEDVTLALNETNQMVIRPAENVTINSSRQETMLTIIVPIKPNAPYPYGSVVYMVKESNLTGVMDSILSDFTGSSYILNQDDEVLTASNHGVTLSQEHLGTLAALDAGIHNLSLNNDKYSVVSVKSGENGWNYMTIMPSYQFFSRVAHVQTLILLVFGIAVITGVLAAFVLARRQYHPIKDLMEFAKLRVSDTPEPKTRNEWEWIRQTLHDYSTRIDMQEPFVRNQCMLLLLKHGKPDDPEIERMIAGAGLESPQEQVIYFCVILSWEENDAAEEVVQKDRQQVHEILSHVEPSGLQANIYGVEFSADNQFALIVSLPDPGQDSLKLRMEQIIRAVQGLISENTRLDPSMGVGTPYRDLGQLNQSFIEAATALEHRMVGSSRITYFDQLAEQNHPVAKGVWLPRKSLLKLEQSLKQGNESVAVQMIAEMMETIRSEPLQIHLLRCICFDLLNALLRSASEVGMNEAFSSISDYTSFETLEEFEDKLLSLTTEICEKVERNHERAAPKLIDDIVHYVNQQFADYTLSLEHVALKFSVSTSYLSRSFKEKTGISFSQYIWKRRTEEVIRLLVTTSAPLKEIIEQVGYLDAPNFIRKFKKETGLTPGQYRKQHRSNRLDI